MDKSEFEVAFRLLGAKIGKPLEIVLGGGSALLVLGAMSRGTKDADVVHSSQKLSAFSKHILEVAKVLNIREDWINDDMQAWQYLLPHDFHERLEFVGEFGQLHVRALGRREVMLMKVAAGRPTDIQDVRELRPSDEDLAWLKEQAVRIGRRDIGDAMMITDYVDLVVGQRAVAEDRARKQGHGNRGA